MRTVIGYNPDGSKVWSDSTPSSVISRHIRGSLVQGGPGTYEQQRRTSAANRAKARAEREAQG